MKMKKVVFAFILVFICCTTSVFAKNVDNKSVKTAEDSIIPTNGYLESTDAIYFIRFVFNDAGGFWGDLSDSDIIESDFYKMCTGQFAGTDKEMEVIKAFLLFLYPQVNRYIAEGYDTLSTSRAKLQTYLEDKCAGMDTLDEEQFNEVRNKALKQVENGIIDFLCSQLAIKTNIVVTESILDDIKTASNVYGNILALPDKIDNFVNTVVTAVSTCLMPMGSELTGRYTYFASYLDCRNLGGPDDVVFQTAMDYNFIACKGNAGLAAGFINFLPGDKVNWTEKRRLIEHWAEFVYQLEQKRDGQPIGTVDISTYYYENPTEDETIDFNWKLYDNGILVIWGDGDLSYSTAPWNDKKERITKVIIHDGITNIGASVFSGYTNLKYVSIPNSVKSIGKSAFYGCTGLTELTIPESVESIGGWAFGNCTGITDVTISGEKDYFRPDNEDSYRYQIFNGCNGIKHVKLTGEGSTAAYSYRDSTPWMRGSAAGNDVTVELEEGITEISPSMFSGCTNLVDITLPESLTVIGEAAFQGCKRLESIGIPEGIESIGSRAFENCTGLSGRFTVPQNLTGVESELFRNCPGITEIVIPDTITYIGSSAFLGCTGLTELTIPESVESIGGCAFGNCTGITDVTISGEKDYFRPDNEDSYRYQIFNGCNGIKHVKLTGEGSTAAYSYRDSTPWMRGSAAGNDVTVELEEGITEISPSMFSGCTNLVDITLPESLTVIGASAFSSCNKLDRVRYNGTKEEWNTISIGPNNEPLINAFLIYKVVYTKPDLILPASTVYIEDEAFEGIHATSVLLSNRTMGIGDKAFANCLNLEQIVIPESVVEISINAFEGCSDLVIIGASGSYAETFAEQGGYLFAPIDSVLRFKNGTTSQND